MTRMRSLWLPSGVFFFFVAFASRLAADGIIIPHPRPGENIPPLTVKYHRVSVEVHDQVARTSIDQVFVNNHDRDIEGTFIFPLPENAAISDFALYIGEKKIEGEILDSREARRVYEDIVRRLKDPGLLEYIGRNTFRARVYPIPARGEKRVQLSYAEILKEERGLIRYVYPLNTERFSFQPIEEVAISVGINSKTPVTNVYSPSHRVSVRKESETRARLGFEEKNVKPDKDFVVYYSVSSADIGLSILNYSDRDASYFMLLAAPRYSEAKEKVINKNLILVLDSSGSMSGKKIQQAREAARFIIDHLDERDHFSIIDFDDGVSLFADELVAASAKNREKAHEFIGSIEDSGGTNINEALLKALRIIPGGERPNYILFLTDGLPTVGVTQTTEILKNVSQANTAKSRLIVFGVGYDVNTELLDKLSAENRGASVYVSETEDLELAVSSVYEKISSPFLSDLGLAFSGIEIYQAYPQTLPDLFKGSQLILLGKYRGSGPASVVLKGKVGKTDKTFSLENKKLVQDEAYNFLPRLWAARRIGYLLDEIRFHGEEKELADEVRTLGLKYGIVTPYTSFLVTEKERLSIAAAAPEAQEALAARKVTGAGAVKLARATQTFKDVEQAAGVISEKIRYKDDKTFYFKDNFWVDSDYKEVSPVVEILFNSDAYFRLITDYPGLAKYLSVAQNVIVVFEGKAYKIL
ncbi:MAG: VIT and VWA domain-containing protein [Clostridiales bacterium]|nr:VIT and VWA domain-containing protein [Clostridiales bacterium]